MTAVGREFPEAKKERKRQNIAKIQVSKSRLYQTETETPIQRTWFAKKGYWRKSSQFVLKLFAGKKQMSRKRTEKKDSQQYSNFWTPPNNEAFTWYMSSSQQITGNVIFASQSPLKPCEWLSVCSKYRNTNYIGNDLLESWPLAVE